MTTHIFHNAHVLTERGFKRDVCVVVEDGFIVAVLHGEPPAGNLIDLDGGYLVPGFIDAQVNGGGGVHGRGSEGKVVEGCRGMEVEAHGACNSATKS